MATTFLHSFKQVTRMQALPWWRVCQWLAGLFLGWMMLMVFFPVSSPKGYSTMVIDRQGVLMHLYLSPDEKWRLKTELSEISPLLQQTILYKEDKLFFYHPGFNPLSLSRAIFNNIVSGRRTSGASTITMQVVRLLEPRTRTPINKCIEIIRALQLEYTYTKQEILQLYLNLIPMGGNLEGVKTASWLYFHKNPDHLSLAEITALSIIPNRPNSLQFGRNNDKLKVARNQWLQRFAKAGLVPPDQVTDALKEPLPTKRLPLPRWAPHYCAFIKNQAGNPIKATIQLSTQEKTQNLVTQYLAPLKLYQIRQAAVIVVNNKNHQVEAYLGSENFLDTLYAGQVNGARAIRQPGSTLKPFLYGLSIDAGLYTPKAKISDVPVNYQGFTPENYDQQFHGETSLEYALFQSLNIPAVKILHQIGTQTLIAKLAECQFKQIAADANKLGLSMILGGCGATLEELTALYSMMANQGLYYPLVFTTTDSVTAPKRILSAAACYMISEMLSQTGRPDFPISWGTTEKLPRIAWKTGTSYGRRDAWSIGYNKNYTIGVWLGNFNGQGIPELSGAAVATPLLFQLFNTLDYNSAEAWYTLPAGCDTRVVCSESGVPPSAHCTQLTTDLFIPLVSSTRTCEAQQLVWTNQFQTERYCRDCLPPTGYLEKWYRTASPELRQWQILQGQPIESPPPHNKNCQRDVNNQAPRITSPEAASEYLVNTEDPEPILFSCQTGLDVQQVFWYLNDKLYKTASPNQQVFVMLDEGKYKLSCTDDRGRTQEIAFYVKKTTW